MGTRNRVGIELSYLPPGYIGCPVGIDSLESILGLLKSLKIRKQIFQAKILKEFPAENLFTILLSKKSFYLFSGLYTNDFQFQKKVIRILSSSPNMKLFIF